MKIGGGRYVTRWVAGSGALLLQVWLSGAVREFSPKVDFQCRLSYGVCTASICSLMSAQLWALYKFQALAVDRSTLQGGMIGSRQINSPGGDDLQ